jgi:hypothetical protein
VPSPEALESHAAAAAGVAAGATEADAEALGAAVADAAGAVLAAEVGWESGTVRPVVVPQAARISGAMRNARKMDRRGMGDLSLMDCYIEESGRAPNL